ncbi:MAG: hypothetical protein ABIF22_02970 [bacterium]
MILTPHAIVGATLANIFPNDPALGFGLAFFSHYILDMLPHTDYDINNFLEQKTQTVKSIFKSFGSALHFSFTLLDLIVAIILCILFFVRDEKTAIITLLGIVGGLLGDFFQFMYYKYKNQPWIFLQKIHDKTHNIYKIKIKPILGYFAQLTLITLVLFIYFWFK